MERGVAECGTWCNIADDVNSVCWYRVKMN